MSELAHVEERELTHMGWSMHPALQPGDVVTVQDVDALTLRPGDIVTFRRGDRLVTHRLVRRAAGTMVTRGDACRSDDAPVALQALMGRVVRVHRRGRTVPLKGHLRRRFDALVFAARCALLETLFRFPPVKRLVRHVLLQRGLRMFRTIGERESVFLKLGNRVVGRYDFVDQSWHIQRPYEPLLLPLSPP